MARLLGAGSKAPVNGQGVFGAARFKPRSVVEAIAVAFTWAFDEVTGVNLNRRTHGVHLPLNRTFREEYVRLGSAVGVGRDACADIYHGRRWLTLPQFQAALEHPELGPCMRELLSPSGPCDIGPLLLAYAPDARHSRPGEASLRHIEGVPPNPSAGSARSRKTEPLKTESTTRVRPIGVRDAVRMVLQDGRPRRSAAIKALVAAVFHHGPLDDVEATAVSSAISHLVIRSEIERLADGRYKATKNLKEPKKRS